MNLIRIATFILLSLCAVVTISSSETVEEITTTPGITSAWHRKTTAASDTTTVHTQSSTTESTTTESTTTEPTTTESPLPTEGDWNVTKDNVTCIRAKLQVEFTVDLGSEKLNFSLSPNAAQKGSSCMVSNTTQQLELSYDNYVLTFLFEKENGNYFVRNLTLALSTLQSNLYFNDDKLFPVKVGNSYLCKSTEHIPMGKAEMHVYKIQVQAFGSKDEEGFGESQECEADDVVNDKIVIAVACALAGLIIIVLVVYLIGRRRSRQRGYTSV